MNNSKAILNEIETENFIWIIYLLIIGLSFLANSFEKDYYINNNLESKDIYRMINIFIFSAVLVVYLYFFKGNFKVINELSVFDSYKKKKFNELNFIASALIVIAGVIFLYIAIYDENLDTEIAFN
ncbi:MAG: hypothetical protein IJE53_07385 [Bacilli bacterium]|nr:hypothetical protein [Bacilli bacterium]